MLKAFSAPANTKGWPEIPAVHGGRGRAAGARRIQPSRLEIAGLPRSPTTKSGCSLPFFTDSAVYPALSPDGRMLAFIRGSDSFMGRGQIYAKLLPSGEPVQLTNDDVP